MSRRLSDRERRHIALFEDKTAVTPRDCVVDTDYDRLLVVVPPGKMADAIGPDGRTVRRVEEAIDMPIKIVADANTPEDLVANALAPAAVYTVHIDEDEKRTIATAEVDEADVGVAIGADGRNIDAARTLAQRHFDIDEVTIA